MASPGADSLWAAVLAMPPRDWLLGALALLLGGLIKGVISIGVPIVALPLLSGLLTVQQSVLLLSLPIVIGNVPQALEGGMTLATVRRIWPLILGMVVGIAIGVRVLLTIPARAATSVAGAVLVLAALLLLLAPRLVLPPRLARRAGLPVGLVSGLLEGLSAIPGPLLATYLIATGATGRRFTKEIALVLVLSVLALVAAFAEGRHADWRDLLVSLLAAIPVLVGILLARPLRDRLPPRLFRAIVLAAVLLAAGRMLRAAL